jgi:hypothetical protein
MGRNPAGGERSVGRTKLGALSPESDSANTADTCGHESH